MISETDIIYFYELSETLHLTRAAERLGVSQPTLSHSLARIENNLGSQLFVRSKKGLSLTASGQRLKAEALQLIEQWKKVKKAVKDEADEIAGLIRLGSHPSVARYTLPLLIPELVETYPKLNFQLEHGLSRHMVDDVLAHRLDVALAINPVRHPDLVIKPILNDTVTLWSSDSEKNKNVLIYNPELIQAQSLIKKLKKSSIHFDREIHSPDLEVIKSLVLSGSGVAILPSRIFTDYELKKVKKIKPQFSFQDSLCLVYRSPFRQLARGRTFIDAVFKNIKKEPS